jgi:hypothetical protein
LPPTLAKNARVGHPQWEGADSKRGKVGHPPWRQWISKNPNASKEEIIEQLNNMKLEFGLTGKGGEIEEEPVIPE